MASEHAEHWRVSPDWRRGRVVRHMSDKMRARDSVPLLHEPPCDDESDVDSEEKRSSPLLEDQEPRKGAKGLGQETPRHLLAMFCLGLLNNSSFVIMIASAKSLLPANVALVYICSSVPSFLLRLSAPYWFDKVTYRARVIMMMFLMPLGYTIVAAAQDNPAVQLLGVLGISAQQGLGECSALALCSRFSHKSLTMWSSGTGLAGLFGYAWVLLLNVGLNFSISTVLLLANGLTIGFFMACVSLSRPKSVMVDASSTSATIPESSSDDGEVVRTSLTPAERLRLTLKLWPWMVPLIVVFMAEYAMQSGVWSAIGFPSSSETARNQFYTYANSCYQAGVFVSRSSGTLYKASTKELWYMPVLQTALLLFFLVDAQYCFWYDNSLLTLCFVSGLAGGITYVNAYRLIQESVEPFLRELATAGGSIASDLGTLMGEVIGLAIQEYLYHVKGLNDA